MRAILICIVIAIILIYNYLVNKKAKVDNAFSNIEVQLSKRYDLIPDLAKMVKVT